MHTSEAGRLGEAAVYKHFTLDGWFVFIDPSGKCPVDLIIYKDGEVRTVSVKTTSSKSSWSDSKWEVQIKTVRSNKTEHKVRPFDPTKVDLLAVYIVPEDRVVVFESSTITQRTAISVDGLT